MDKNYLSIKEFSKQSGIALSTLKDRCLKGKYDVITEITSGCKGFGYFINKKHLLTTSGVACSSSLLEPFAPFATSGGATHVDNGFVDGSTSSMYLPPFTPLATTKNHLITPSTEIANNLFDELGLSKNTSPEPIFFTPEQKTIALEKVKIVSTWEEFRYDKQNKSEADETFLEGYNSGLICPKSFKIIGKISKATLHRWGKIYRDSGNDYTALINDYKNKSEFDITTCLGDIEKTLLLKYMLHQNKFKLGRAYELIKYELNAQGIENISSYSAYLRVWNYIKKNYADKVAFARGGKKFFNDTQMSYIVRDWSKVPAGEMLVGDGHTLDFMIKDPYTGKPARATMVGFVDCATRDLVGYEIMMTEDTQCIASALRNAVKYLKKVPKVVQLDNGRAFKSKFFNNSHTEYSHLGGVYSRLGIETYYSRAYNGRAKIIERFFKEFTESMAKLLSSYCGGSIETKPAYMMRNETDHRKLRELNGSDCPTIEEVKTYLDLWLEKIYRQRNCNFDKSKTIAEVISLAKGAGVQEDILDDLMCGYDKRKCGRNGIKLFGQLYFNHKMLGLDSEVVVKYSLTDLNSVHIFTLNGEKICCAERVQAVCAQAELFGTPQDVAEYKYQLRQQKALEKARLTGLKKGLKQLYKNPISKVTPSIEIEEKPQTKYRIPKIDLEDNLLEMIPDNENVNKYKCINYYE